MALADLMDRLGGSDPDDDLDLSAPDDLSELDDAPDRLTPDPKPKRGKATKLTAVRSAGTKVSVAQKRAVHDALTLVLTLPAGAWAMRDPHCGGIAMAQREATINALVPIICRNPTMLAWFTAGDGGWMDWAALIVALQPLASATWSHHVRKIDPDEARGPAGGEGLDLSQFTA